MPGRLVQQVELGHAYVAVIQGAQRTQVARALREVPHLGRVCSERTAFLESNGLVWRAGAQFVPYASWVRRGGEVSELRSHLKRVVQARDHFAVTVAEVLGDGAGTLCATARWMNDAERSASERVSAVAGGVDRLLEGASDAAAGVGKGAGELLSLAGGAAGLAPWIVGLGGAGFLLYAAQTGMLKKALS